MKLSDLPKRIHFVGVGGIGTSALALHLAKCGHIVSGSDRVDSDVLRRLRSSGINAFVGHDRANVGEAQAVVMTSAVRSDNPEVAFALERGLPVLLREEVLGMIFDRFPRRVAVCGTHGKTTVTAMISHVLSRCGVRHTAFIGGEYNGSNYVGEGCDLVVAEACEYNRSFLHLHPTVCVCLNAEFDHPDCYEDEADVRAAFAAFMDNVPSQGTVILPENLQYLTRKNTFAVGRGGSFCAKNVRCNKGKPSFDLYVDSEFVCKVRLSVVGRHNVNDALFSLAAAYKLNVPLLQAAAAMTSFCGVNRRWTEVGGCEYKVVCDYAHHPTEIACAVQTAKSVCKGKLVCLFQPHTYSRTAAFWQQFVTCFDGADAVAYLPIYSAREQPLQGVTSQNLSKLARHLGVNATYCQDFASAVDFVRSTAQKGDLVLVLGAGDVVSLAPMLT